MSDPPRYGTPEKPWPELPPAASLYGVAWGGLAVEFGDKAGPTAEAAMREPEHGPVVLRR